MAKKRKASGRATAQQPDSYADNGKRVKMNIRTYEDVADSEDEWDLARDKILLEEGPDRKRQRQYDERDAEGEDGEVEVLGLPEEENDEEQEYETENEGEYDEEDEEGWGANEAYGADIAENEEDAREIEAEAIRLQKKRLEGLTDADFGFDEDEWRDDGPDNGEEGGQGKHVEKLPELEITDDMPAEERERILKARYPEFEPLAKEFLALRPLAEKMKLTAAAAQARYEKSRKLALVAGRDFTATMPASVVSYNALTGYMATLAMYFAVFSSNAEIPEEEDEQNIRNKPMDPKELREHSIMDYLMRSRALWEQVRDLDLKDEPELDVSEPEDTGDTTVFYTPKESPIEKNKSLLSTQPPPGKRKSMTRAGKAALKAQAEAKAKQDAQLRKLDEDMAQLSKTLAATRRSKSSHAERAVSAADGDDSDFGDEIALTAHAAQEKARRKKTLRFYTSQIAQKAKKSEARIHTSGGDADLPHRERLKDRVARLNAEAEARGKKKGLPLTDELGGSSGDEDDRAAAKEVRGDEDNEYYQQISARTNAKKEADKARKAAQKEAVLRGGRVTEVTTVGEDGKRAIGYTIEKNKGLTPNRKKSVRNPRKKKREAFEKKKKRLGSVKQVYKGGEGRGGYGGELTGIKKGLVRSTKL